MSLLILSIDNMHSPTYWSNIGLRRVQDQRHAQSYDPNDQEKFGPKEFTLWSNSRYEKIQ